MVVKIFVYGTLKPGEVNYQRYCASKVLEAKRAVAFGRLYALPFGYPAMTLGDSCVQGFVLTFADIEILSQLDWLESYNPQKPASDNEYNRQEITTFNTALDLLGSAWTYLMTPERVAACGGILLTDGWWSNSFDQSQ